VCVDAGVGLSWWGGVCCLVDMLGVEGDAGAAVEAGVHVGWNGFGQLVPLLACRDVSLMWMGDCVVVVLSVIWVLYKQ